MVPAEVHKAAVSRARAGAVNDYKTVDDLHKSIVDAGYRGIDAPESAMPYGKNSKEEFAKLVEEKRLTVNIYGSNPYGRFVGNVYFNNIFIQAILKRRRC